MKTKMKENGSDGDGRNMDDDRLMRSTDEELLKLVEKEEGSEEEETE